MPLKNSKIYEIQKACQKCGIIDIDVLSIDHIWETIDRPKRTRTAKQILCQNCHKKKTLYFRKTRKLLNKHYLTEEESIKYNQEFLSNPKETKG